MDEKYSAALERAKIVIFNAYHEETKTACKEIFPELAENEDEKIRKLNLWFLRKYKEISHLDDSSEEGIDMVISYLEKQKEQPKEELVYRLNGLMQDYIKEGKDEEEREHRFKCYKLFWDALEDSTFFEQKEQKPDDWTDADEKILERIINRQRFVIPVPGDGLVNVTFKHSEDTEAINWLKRRVTSQPRPKQEWDDGDVLMLKNIKACLRGQIDSTPDMAPWLTELPYRFNLLPQQMITEEVYFCVKTAIDYYMDRIHDEQIGPRLTEFVRQLQSIVYWPVRATSSVK